MSERLYHLVMLKSSGAYERLTSYPMTHAECMVNKSKFRPSTQAGISVREFHPGASLEAFDAALAKEGAAR